MSKKLFAKKCEVVKKFVSKFFCDQTFCEKKIQKICPKNIQLQKCFGPKKFGPKNVWYQNSEAKNLRSKNFKGRKKFWVQKILGQKYFWGQSRQIISQPGPNPNLPAKPQSSLNCQLGPRLLLYLNSVSMYVCNTRIAYLP